MGRVPRSILHGAVAAALLYAALLVAVLLPAAAARSGAVDAREVSAKAAFAGRIERSGQRCSGPVRNVRGQGRSCRTSRGLWKVFVKGRGAVLTHGPDVIRGAAGDAFAASVANASPGSVHCSPAASLRYRVIYAVPAGETDQSATRVAQVRQMVEGASEVVRQRAASLDQGRDVRVRVECNADGLVDVRTVQLPTSTGADSFATIVRDLTALGHIGGGYNTLVYLEGGVGGYGGQGAMPSDDTRSWSNAANAGGRMAVVYRASPSYAWRTALHEISHNLGAVQNGAPNSSLAGHCTDGLDVMCYADGGSRTYTTTRCTADTFDCGADDYFHPAPAATSWLASHVNLAAPQNQFFRHARTGDTTRPVLEFLEPTANGAAAQSVRLAGGDDVGIERIEVRVDGALHATVGVLPATVSLAGLANGAHVVSAVAIDTSGNTSVLQERSITFDAVGPDLDPGPVPSSAGDWLVLRPRPADPSGIREVRAYTSTRTYIKDTTAPWELRIPVSTLPPGAAAWRLVAIDAAGNESEVTVRSTISRGIGVAVSWFDDDAATQLKLASTNAGPIQHGWGLLSPTASVAADTWSGRWQGRIRIPDSAPVQFKIVADERASLRVGGVEVAATAGPGLQMIDSTPATWPAGDLQPFRLDFVEDTGAAAMYLFWKLGDGAWVPVPLVHLFPETQVPTVALTAPAAGAVLTDTVDVAATAADNHAVARVDFLIDGRKVGSDRVAPFTYSWVTPSFTNGAHLIEAISYDPSGNRSTTASRTVSLDNGNGLVGTYFGDANFTQRVKSRLDRSLRFAWLKAPFTPLPADGFSVRWEGSLRLPSGPAPSLVITHDDGVRVWADGQLVIDSGGLTGLATSQVPLTGAPGDLVDLRIDYVEQVETAKFTLGWNMGGTVAQVPTQYLYTERAAPAVSITSPADGSSVYRRTTVAVDAQDPSGVLRVELLLGDLVVGTDATAPYGITWSPTVALNGARELRARAVDIAGNVGTSQPVDVTVDIGTGLSGSCWDETDFATSPIAGQVLQSTFALSWLTNTPCAGMGADSWSVRYAGDIRIPTSSAWSLFVTSDDGIRVRIGGVVMVDAIGYTGDARIVRIDLPAGAADRRLPIEIDKVDQAGNASLQLRWSSPEQPLATVPSTVLYP